MSEIIESRPAKNPQTATTHNAPSWPSGVRLSESESPASAFAVAGGSGFDTPDKYFCPSCGHGPLFSWERAGDGCCKCNETQPITLTEADVESAIRAFVCACRPELAVGWRIDVRVRLLGGAASATAWRSPNNNDDRQVR